MLVDEVVEGVDGIEVVEMLEVVDWLIEGVERLLVDVVGKVLEVVDWSIVGVERMFVDVVELASDRESEAFSNSFVLDELSVVACWFAFLDSLW